MIYYFTGTGNSRYIARELHQQLNEDYISVNYPRPKGHGLVTAQSYKRFTPPTFNPNRYCYLKWRYIIGWLTAPFVAEFTLLQLY